MKSSNLTFYLWLGSSPIKTRRKMRRKKKPHDSPYTMAVVVEYDTIVYTKLRWKSMAPLCSTLVCTKTKTIVPTLACFISLRGLDIRGHPLPSNYTRGSHQKKGGGE